MKEDEIIREKCSKSSYAETKDVIIQKNSINLHSKKIWDHKVKVHSFILQIDWRLIVINFNYMLIICMCGDVDNISRTDHYFDPKAPMNTYL